MLASNPNAPVTVILAVPSATVVMPNASSPVTVVLA